MYVERKREERKNEKRQGEERRGRRCERSSKLSSYDKRLSRMRRCESREAKLEVERNFETMKISGVGLREKFLEKRARLCSRNVKGEEKCARKVTHLKLEGERPPGSKKRGGRRKFSTRVSEVPSLRSGSERDGKR
jgi:hypothetical protein